MPNAYQRLRSECLANSTRPFGARGIAVKRCRHCLLGQRACICSWQLSLKINIDIVLLMHRDEVFKPTNSGRLIADLLPDNTYAFEWSRTRPPAALLNLLQQPKRYPVVVFPPPEQTSRRVHQSCETLPADKKLTLILLDGTWKQARKMFKTSLWMQSLPLFELTQPPAGNYGVRKAFSAGQLATAEAAAALLTVCNEAIAGQALSDYFALFNQHYLATRMNVLPQAMPHHDRLQQLKALAAVPPDAGAQ